jgi:hypothetical protein
MEMQRLRDMLIHYPRGRIRDIACHRLSPGENHVRLDDQRSTVLDEAGLASIAMQATWLVLAFLDV